LLNQFDQDYEGETLNELHRFCTTTTRSTNDDEDNLSNIDATVIYINNQGPIQLRQEGISLRNVILHTTMAVTDRLCSLHQHKPPSPISSSTSNDNNNQTCNVCGLIFYTIWTFFYPGNMFTAKCSYVRQLLSPKVYEYQMTNHVIGKILLAKIRMKLTMSLIPKLDRHPDYIGLDRYSIDYWISSHPHIHPCDLSDINHNYEYWDRSPPLIEPSIIDIHNDVNNGNDNSNRIDTLVKSPSYFHLEAGPPRHGNSIPSILLYFDIMKNWTTVRDNVLLDESKRLREYCYLAGHIFKWYELYNMTPPNDSWVWATDYFPDATIWREAVRKHGKDSIDVITAKYAKDGM
jgi:hypothetical protein